MLILTGWAYLRLLIGMRIKISIVTLLMLCTRSSPGICNINFITSLTKINGKSYTFNQLYDTTNNIEYAFQPICRYLFRSCTEGFQRLAIMQTKIQYHQTVAQWIRPIFINWRYLAIAITNSIIILNFVKLCNNY